MKKSPRLFLPIALMFLAVPLFAAKYVLNHFPGLTNSKAQVSANITETNRNVRFGLPTAASPDASSREDFLIERPQYVLSYNDKLHRPNWVCWSLRQEDIGHSVRGQFVPDPTLPPGFGKITTHVFDGSGFDRGHMCPAQDRSSEQKDMDATFYLTNIVAQSPFSNQRGWERLEAYCRQQTKSGQVVHICCGPWGVGGAGRNGPKQEVSKGNLATVVPAKIWKVIMILPDEKAEPTTTTRTIAIIMPNDQTVDWDWPKYRVSIREVEALTGFTFFRNLPADVAQAIKGRVDTMPVRVPPAKAGGAE